MEPDSSSLLPLLQILERAGITAALGGSGLLWSLGLAEGARDWDLTTDAPLEQVERALDGLAWTQAPHGDASFASAYRLAISFKGMEVDLIGAFAFRTAEGVCHLPTVVVGEWQGVPVGSPEVWAVAYRLMGRHGKADLLSECLRTNGARDAIVARLLTRPLPESIRTEIQSWSK